MTSNDNPIQERYWKKIWALRNGVFGEITEDQGPGDLEKTLIKVSATSRWKAAVVMGLIVAFFILVPYKAMLDYEALTYPEVFIYRWIGFGLAYILVYWLIFLMPFDNLPRKGNLSIPEYIQEVVYENPKSPGEFISHHFEEQKYEWASFIYLWTIGYASLIFIESNNWMLIVPYQSYWLNQLPSVIPIAVMLGVISTLVFAMIIGTASPTTARGKLKKTVMMITIAIVIMICFIITAKNAAIMTDFFQNWEDYSIYYPRDTETPALAWPLDEAYVNYNVFWWTIGMFLSSVIAVFFALVLNLYHNLKIRDAVEEVYHDYLEQNVESLWEYAPVGTRHDDEVKLKKKIRVISGIELTGFFSLVMFAFWGIYSYWGEKVGNQDMENLGIVIMGLLLLWAMIFAPIYHYHLEKPINYREKYKNLGYACFEDRGIGSPKRFFQRERHKPEVKKILVVINILSLMGLAVLLLREQQVTVSFADMLNQPLDLVIGALSLIYSLSVPVLLIFSITVLKFDDESDPERGFKRIYSAIFIGFLFGLTLGIAGVFHDYGYPIELFVAGGGGSAIAFFGMLGLMLAVLGIFNIVWFPIFVRYDNLYETIPDLLQIIVAGIVVLVSWNYLCEIFLDPLSGISHESWNLNDNPVELRENFHWGNFIENVFGYHYWGWVQELLFLSYFCWLSWKIFPENKWANAVISAILFAMFHWHNMPLMLGTAIGGFMWAIWWGEKDVNGEFHHRNLWMMGLMHGFNGSLVDFLIPMSMRVGPQ